jgi:Transposase DDE domain
VRIVSGIKAVAEGLVAEFKRLLPWQRKTQRDNLALLTATMLDVRSANLMDLAAALPREADRADMRYQWIARVLGNGLIDPDAVMEPFAREVLSRAASADGQSIVLIMDQSKLSNRHQVLMLALRHGERALPLAWRVEATEGAIGFDVQRELLETVAPWLPEAAQVCLMADRFYGTADLISLCQDHGWDYRLRLKGNLIVGDRRGKKTKTGTLADGHVFTLQNVQLTAKRATTNIGVIRDPSHDEAWIIAMSAKPSYLRTLDYSSRWAIEPMFSDFKSRGFGVEDTQILHPDRLARLLLVMALALYCAVSTGMWDAENHPIPAEKNCRSISRRRSRAPSCPGSREACGASRDFSKLPCHCRPYGPHETDGWLGCGRPRHLHCCRGA